MKSTIINIKFNIKFYKFITDKGKKKKSFSFRIKFSIIFYSILISYFSKIIHF